MQSLFFFTRSADFSALKKYSSLPNPYMEIFSLTKNLVGIVGEQTQIIGNSTAVAHHITAVHVSVLSRRAGLSGGTVSALTRRTSYGASWHMWSYGDVATTEETRGMKHPWHKPKRTRLAFLNQHYCFFMSFGF